MEYIYSSFFRSVLFFGSFQWNPSFLFKIFLFAFQFFYSIFGSFPITDGRFFLFRFSPGINFFPIFFGVIFNIETVEILQNRSFNIKSKA